MAKRKDRPRRDWWDEPDDDGPRLRIRGEDRARSRGRERGRGPEQKPPNRTAAGNAEPWPPAPMSAGPVQPVPLVEAPALACGRCTEWLADDMGGRGECLHPGSGILKPWWDTPACPFFH
jgi:hypothetical protein